MKNLTLSQVVEMCRHRHNLTPVNKHVLRLYGHARLDEATSLFDTVKVREACGLHLNPLKIDVARPARLLRAVPLRGTCYAVYEKLRSLAFGTPPWKSRGLHCARTASTITGLFMYRLISSRVPGLAHSVANDNADILACTRKHLWNCSALSELRKLTKAQP